MKTEQKPLRALAPRILFVPNSHKAALGHLSRVRNIASAIRDLSHDVMLSFLVRELAPHSFLAEYDQQPLNSFVRQRRHTASTTKYLTTKSPSGLRRMVSRAARSGRLKRVLRRMNVSTELYLRSAMSRISGESYEEGAELKGVRSLRPNVLVLDSLWNTRLLDACGRRGASCVIYREHKAELFEDPSRISLCCRADRIIVPHEEDSDFSQQVLQRYGQRVRCVGEIVREPSPRRAAEIRSSIELGPDSRLITLTFGGGGTLCHDTPRTFSPAMNLQIAAKIAEQNPDDVFLFVSGPFSSINKDTDSIQLENLSVIRTHEELPSLLMASDLVVSTAGYNTVNELRAAETPAVLMPRPCVSDDQFGRASRLADAGQAIVAESRDSVVEQVNWLLSDHEALSSLRSAAKQNVLRTGAPRAAKEILE